MYLDTQKNSAHIVIQLHTYLHSRYLHTYLHSRYLHTYLHSRYILLHGHVIRTWRQDSACANSHPHSCNPAGWLACVTRPSPRFATIHIHLWRYRYVEYLLYVQNALDSGWRWRCRDSREIRPDRCRLSAVLCLRDPIGHVSMHSPAAICTRQTKIAATCVHSTAAEGGVSAEWRLEFWRSVRRFKSFFFSFSLAVCWMES